MAYPKIPVPAFNINWQEKTEKAFRAVTAQLYEPQPGYYTFAGLEGLVKPGSATDDPITLHLRTADSFITEEVFMGKLLQVIIPEDRLVAVVEAFKRVPEQVQFDILAHLQDWERWVSRTNERKDTMNKKLYEFERKAQEEELEYIIARVFVEALEEEAEVT